VDHDVIEELLAGYALRALSGEDAAEADRLLTEHVPSCVACRAALAGFQEVAGELALDASPMSPPEVLLPRLHRELDRRSAWRRPSALAAAAAGLVVMMGLGAFALDQGMRANHFAQRSVQLAQLADFTSQPGARSVSVGDVTGVVHAGVEDFYLEGSHVPPPSAGTVYHVWVMASGSTYRHLGRFVPDDGFVLIELRLDPTRYDQIVISEQPPDVTSGTPQNVRWRSGL
jgi:predicted anti-sigma-YlaC factor YlaD